MTTEVIRKNSDDAEKLLQYERLHSGVPQNLQTTTSVQMTEMTVIADVD